MRYLRELFIPFTNNFQGLFHGILGPTLLDIEQLTGTTTAQVSLMFTAMTVGALAGAPVGAYQTGKITALMYMSFKRVSECLKIDRCVCVTLQGTGSKNICTKDQPRQVYKIKQKMFILFVQVDFTNPPMGII